MLNVGERIYSKKKIYAAYRMVKNNCQNQELQLEKEILFFESDLMGNIDKISNCLKTNKYDFFSKFDFLLRIKNISEDDMSDKINFDYRPIVRFRFFDEVLIQSVFNVISEELKNCLPNENLGVQLNDGESYYFYKNWQYQYKKFVNKQKRNLESDTTFNCVYEYDLKDFYPSIQQGKLIRMLKELLKCEDEFVNESTDVSKFSLEGWIETIIGYFKPENISEETKGLFKIYCKKRVIDKKDLGLPQGPLFSAFLSSLYTKDSYKQIQNKLKEKGFLNSEIFSYVDDGRIFLRENVGVDEIKEIVDSVYSEINEADYNNKKICTNESKCSLLYTEDKSCASILRYLSSDISLVNASINANQEIDEALFNAITARHENYEFQIQKLLNSSKLGINKEDEENKIKKEYSTYSKRKASFLTRKIAYDKKFYLLVDQIFDIDWISNVENKSTKSLNTDITDINFYYCVMNLLKYCHNCQEKYSYLLTRVVEYLNTYKKACENINVLTYYYLCLLKCIQSFDATDESKKWYIEIRDIFEQNDLIKKYLNSSAKLSWIKIYSECEMIFDYKDTNDFEVEALQHYNSFPLKLLELRDDIFFAESVQFNITEDSEIELNGNYWISECKKYYKILVCRANKQVDISKKNDLGNMQNLNDAYISKIDNLKIINTLLAFWESELENNDLVNPSFINFDNVFFKKDEKNNDKDTELIIFNVYPSEYNELEIKIESSEYKKLFTSFFMELFKLDDTILIKRNGTPLEFWEYRIMAYLNYRSFDLNAFFNMVSEMLDECDYFCGEVDFNYDKVRKLIDLELGSSNDKDIILQLHYYLENIWKNGSKDLTFFTLHNQEHSLELVQNYSLMNEKLLGYLNLNKDEKFILFAACYLHDVGMLNGVTSNEKVDQNNGVIATLYGKINEMLSKMQDKNSNKKFEGFLYDIYSITDLVSSTLEGKVRNDHPKTSKKMIEKNDFLPLSGHERSLIARVSENHAYKASKIFGQEDYHVFRGRRIDVRKISFWLRLLDLSDITKKRVSHEVFAQYFDRLGPISTFHWIKHFCVNDIEFSVSQDKMGEKGEENTHFKISVIFNYLPAKDTVFYDKSNCYIFIKDNEEAPYYREKEKCSDENKCPKCNLRCLFLNEFKYFDEEVVFLNKYLEKNDINLDFSLEYVYDKNKNSIVNSKSFSHRKMGRKTVDDYIKQYFDEVI
ncbi:MULTISPECIES: hypothetical protein [unclassified Breznakia]|nr:MULTISPECIES: hypothetical protein [unclassified Breznakia]